MFDRPALSYGLFHAQVRPNKLYGIVTTGITFQGLNMDIGHLRHTRWVKNDDPSAAINAKPELTSNGKTAAQNRWIAYNKMRGQYSSAMEHAVPEQFWVDKSQCRYTDEQGQIQNPTKADCAQAVSAVKAIAIAQAEGQRIYTINQSNAATALPKLPVGGTVGQEIQSAIQAGKEVTFHERAINAHGFSGMGYIITDPETGAGAYMIEGKGNGGIFLLGFFFGLALISLIITLPYLIPFIALGGFLSFAIIGLIVLNFAILIDSLDDVGRDCFYAGLIYGASLILATLGLLAGTALLPAIAASFITRISGYAGFGLTAAGPLLPSCQW